MLNFATPFSLVRSSAPNLNRLIHCDEAVVCSILIFLHKCRSMRSVQQIHAQIVIHDAPLHNHLLSKLIVLNDSHYSFLLFRRIHNPNVFSFNIMIRALATSWKNYSLALQFYDRMRLLHLNPDHFTFPFLFISCANIPSPVDGKSGQALVLKSGLANDGHICHSMITMYSKLGELVNARKLFDEIPQKTVVSWNSMISGYAKMGCPKDAVNMFEDMKKSGTSPDEMTLVSVLSASGDLGDLKVGNFIEGYVRDNNMKVNVHIASALIDLYSKCGELSKARRIFNEVKHKDVVIWNSMISGYTQNGEAEEAIRVFDSMRASKCELNSITMVTALSACAAAGAIELGRWIESYTWQRGWKGDAYIATALIDMYAKCGRVEDSQRVFSSSEKKNVATWNAMISALAFHGKNREALWVFHRMRAWGVRADHITFVGALSACVHGGLIREGKAIFESMEGEGGVARRVEHYTCVVDMAARAGMIEEAWGIVEGMGEKDEVALGAVMGACRKRGKGAIGEKVAGLLLEKAPMNSGNYVVSAKMYGDMMRWNEAAELRKIMKDRGVIKTPGCSWLLLHGERREFHAGDYNAHFSNGVYQHLILEMFRCGYVPNLHSL